MAFDTSDPKVQKAMLIVLLLLGGCYAYFAYVYTPKQEALDKVKSELETVQRSVETARSIVNAADTTELVNELEKRTGELAMLEKLLPEQEQLALLLNNVTRIGNLAGVDFALFEPRTPVQHEIYQERPYSVTIRGGYHEAARFLADVASLTQVIKPSGVSLARDVTESATPGRTLTGQMTLTTYLMIPAPKEPKTPQGAK